MCGRSAISPNGFTRPIDMKVVLSISMAAEDDELYLISLAFSTLMIIDIQA